MQIKEIETMVCGNCKRSFKEPALDEDSDEICPYCKKGVEDIDSDDVKIVAELKNYSGEVDEEDVARKLKVLLNTLFDEFDNNVYIEVERVYACRWDCPIEQGEPA